MKQVTFILLTCFLWLAGASAALPENAQISKLEPITLESADSVTMLTAEIADTDELRTRGLMFRHFLPEDKAMLFDYQRPQPVAMWMKNTNISLDMLFIRQDGTIAAIAQDTVPKSLDTISVQEPVRGVLELAAGTVRRLGLKVNDKVYHRIFNTVED
ncbi:MAG: DUF192 domain-containing protein [Aestuariivirga sp.]